MHWRDTYDIMTLTIRFDPELGLFVIDFCIFPNALNEWRLSAFLDLTCLTAITIENIMKNGEFAPDEQILYFP